jgi:hypothetical protein
MVAIVAVRGVSGMQSAQTIAAAVFGLAGASIFAVGKYQKANHVIGKVPLLSARGKHVIGLILLFLGLLIFLSQFVGSGTKRVGGRMAGAAIVPPHSGTSNLAKGATIVTPSNLRNV